MRLIDADALFKQFAFYNGNRIPETDVDNFPITVNLRDIKNSIRKAPTIDPLKHGEWIPIPEYGNKRCSACNTVFSDFTLGYYCPSCGARMDNNKKELGAANT
jgi:rubredoxin